MVVDIFKTTLYNCLQNIVNGTIGDPGNGMIKLKLMAKLLSVATERGRDAKRHLPNMVETIVKVWEKSLRSDHVQV